jgi:DNA-binding response OmpR family regulator
MTNLRRPSVLVAIADASDRATISAAAVELGYPTISVATEAAAWQSFQQALAEIVIVDANSKSVDGLQLCEQIREMAADQCGVAAVAADDRSGHLARILAGGVDDVIVKPVTATAVAARLQVLERLVAARRAQRATNLEVIRLRSLASVGQTALTFQHEINNPLTALYAYLELLATDAPLSEAATSDLSGAVAQAQRIQAVVRQLTSPALAADCPSTPRRQTAQPVDRRGRLESNLLCQQRVPAANSPRTESWK